VLKVAPDGTQVELPGSTHAPPAHGVPVLHAGPYGCPQATQLPPEQVFVPLQVLPAQHAWPAPPQPAQVPDDWQRSPLAQVAPLARHTRAPLVSQQPAPHTAPGQHV
jgi:hypothetical protein